MSKLYSLLSLVMQIGKCAIYNLHPRYITSILFPFSWRNPVSVKYRFSIDSQLRILLHISCWPTIPQNLWLPAEAQGHVPNIAGTSGSGVCTIVIWSSVTRWRPMKSSQFQRSLLCLLSLFSGDGCYDNVVWKLWWSRHRPWNAADAGGKAKKSRRQFQIVDFQQPAFHCLEQPSIVGPWGARRQELYGCTCFFFIPELPKKFA